MDVCFGCQFVLAASQCTETCSHISYMQNNFNELTVSALCLPPNLLTAPYIVPSRWSLYSLYLTKSITLHISKLILSAPLQWRHNEHDGVSNNQPHDCLLNRLFRHRSQKTPKLRVTGLCVGNSPVTGEFPAQKASNAENVSIWWRHHASICHVIFSACTPSILCHCLWSNPVEYGFCRPLPLHITLQCANKWTQSLTYILVDLYSTLQCI